MGDMQPSDAQKIEVLKKAVLKLQQTSSAVEDENARLQQTVAELERQNEAHKASQRQAADEAELLRFNATTQNKKVTALETELKEAKKAQSGLGMITGLKGIIGASGGKDDAEREVLVEELQHKIAESEQLHSRIYDMQARVKELERERANFEQGYGEETIRAVSRISELEEQLRLSGDEAATLRAAGAESAEEMAQLRTQHRGALERMRELQERLAAAASLSARTALADPARLPALGRLTLSPRDEAAAAAAASLAAELGDTVGHVVRDVEALFANATERVHILLSSEAATGGSPVRVAALRLLKDSLRKATAAHGERAAALLEASAAAAASRRGAHTALLAAASGGGDAATTAAAAAAARSPDAADAAARWAGCVGEGVRHVLVALFVHSPSGGGGGEDAAQADEEVSRLHAALSQPLKTGGLQAAAALRQLRGAVKDLAEVVTALFAREVKAAWELTGFDGVNKRIMTVLKALHSHVVAAVELRGSVAKEADLRAEGARGGCVQQVGVLPPEAFVSEEERAVLPQTYFEDASPYEDVDLARVRMHGRVAAFMRRVSDIPLDFGPLVAAGAAGAGAGDAEGVAGSDDGGEDVSAPAQQCSLLEVAPTPPSPGLAPGLATAVPPSGALLGQQHMPHHETPPQHARELEAYRHALSTADAKAVEYRIEWQRSLFDLETRAEALQVCTAVQLPFSSPTPPIHIVAHPQELEDESRDLKRRLRNRDLEVKNMSHGYTDQMKVFQDRILDLENRLAAASSPKGK